MSSLRQDAILMAKGNLALPGMLDLHNGLLEFKCTTGPTLQEFYRKIVGIIELAIEEGREVNTTHYYSTCPAFQAAMTAARDSWWVWGMICLLESAGEMPAEQRRDDSQAAQGVIAQVCNLIERHSIGMEKVKKEELKEFMTPDAKPVDSPNELAWEYNFQAHLDSQLQSNAAEALGGSMF